MAKILTLDEMLDALERLQDPDAARLIAEVVALADEVAAMLQKHFRAEVTEASFEPGFGGTAVAFHRLEGGPGWPEQLADLDEGGEFDTHAEALAELDATA